MQLKYNRQSSLGSSMIKILIRLLLTIIIFIFAYFNGGIFFATKALMIAMPIGLCLQWAHSKKINKTESTELIIQQLVILDDNTIIFQTIFR